MTLRKSPDDPAEHSQWIKTGLELYNGTPRLSTVTCDRWADWSIAPVPDYGADAVATQQTVSVSVEKEVDAAGRPVSFWVYYLAADGSKLPMREICWVYGAGEAAGDLHLSVGAFVARPESKKTESGLDVSFSDLQVEWSTTA